MWHRGSLRRRHVSGGRGHGRQCRSRKFLAEHMDAMQGNAGIYANHPSISRNDANGLRWRGQRGDIAMFQRRQRRLVYRQPSPDHEWGQSRRGSHLAKELSELLIPTGAGSGGWRGGWRGRRRGQGRLANGCLMNGPALDMGGLEMGGLV